MRIDGCPFRFRAIEREYRSYWTAVEAARIWVVTPSGQVGCFVVGDVNVQDVWERLKSDPASVLIDVRTRAEWMFVGLPDLSALGKRVVTLEWQSFPENSVDPAFSDRLKAALSGSGADKGTNLYFICRSGARSRMAAEALAAAGYEHCHNVADGFEGPLDPNRHRGRIGGWKAAGLAWAQG